MLLWMETTGVELLITIDIVLLGIGLALLFFLEDLYNTKVRIHPSLIAGIGLSYFFLVVLPEVGVRIPEYPLHLRNFEYLFFLIGITFIHISEKFILQKVEVKTRTKAHELIQHEETLEAVEKNISSLITQEISSPNIDLAALRELSQILTSLNRQEKTLRNDIISLKKTIQAHVSKDLEELRHFTKLFYHFLIGFILFNILILEIIEGLLFFLFAFFFALIDNAPHEKLYSDLDIEEIAEEPGLWRYIVATSTLIGLIVGIISASIAPPNLEVFYLIFSFISGVILYRIMREVIPQKEQGNIKLFLLGGIGFGLFIYIINYFAISNLALH